MLLLGTLAALGPLSIDMYLPSFPAIAGELGTDVASVQLSLSSYLAGLAVGQLVYGPLADRFGRRRPLLGGLAIYLVGAIGCALAPGLHALVAARFVQALGGCAGMVIGRAVVRDLFGPEASARLLSAQILVSGAAPILAPLVGGQVLALAGWRAIFALLAAIAAAVATLVHLGLAESLPAARRSTLHPRALAAGFGSVLGSATFLRWTCAGAGLHAAMFAYIAGSPFVFIELYGVPAERYGLLFGANAIGLVAVSQLNRLLIRRWGMERTLHGAVLVAFAAYVGLVVAAAAHAPLAVLVPALFLGVASVGAAMPNATAIAMAPFGGQAGVASAVIGTVQMAFGALASALTAGLADGTALPMAGVMLGCAAISVALLAPLPGLQGATARRPAP